MTDTSPTDQLHAAATKLRTIATAPGITPGPWVSLDHGDRLLYDGPGAEDQPPVYVVDEPMSNGTNADYIATMDPTVGLGVAQLLDAIARTADDGGAAFVDEALAVARQILGEDASRA